MLIALTGPKDRIQRHRRNISLLFRVDTRLPSRARLVYVFSLYVLRCRYFDYLQGTFVIWCYKYLGCIQKLCAWEQQYDTLL